MRERELVIFGPGSESGIITLRPAYMWPAQWVRCRALRYYLNFVIILVKKYYRGCAGGQEERLGGSERPKVQRWGISFVFCF